MPHLTFQTTSEDETIALGVALGRMLRSGDVLGLDGELGAGKTRLVRGIAEGLGLDPAQVSSPTYVLIHEYTHPLGAGSGAAGDGTFDGSPTSRFVETPLYHVDAYRLENLCYDAVRDAGVLDAVERGDAVTVIEWPERIAEFLPSPRFRVTLTPGDGDLRHIEIESR